MEVVCKLIIKPYSIESKLAINKCIASGKLDAQSEQTIISLPTLLNKKKSDLLVYIFKTKFSNYNENNINYEALAWRMVEVLDDSIFRSHLTRCLIYFKRGITGHIKFVNGGLKRLTIINTVDRHERRSINPFDNPPSGDYENWVEPIQSSHTRLREVFLTSEDDLFL